MIVTVGLSLHRGSIEGKRAKQSFLYREEGSEVMLMSDETLWGTHLDSLFLPEVDDGVTEDRGPRHSGQVRSYRVETGGVVPITVFMRRHN